MLELREKEGGSHTCPLCRDTLDTEPHSCLGCETTYHTACLAELGGCSTLGCRLQGELPDAIPSWFCRACHRPIESDLTRRNCRCGAYLHDECVEAHGAGCQHAAELCRPPPTNARRGVTEPAQSSTRAAPVDIPGRSTRRIERRSVPLSVVIVGLVFLCAVALLGLTLLERVAAGRSPGPHVGVAAPELRSWSADELVAVLRTQGREGSAYRELVRRGPRITYDLLRSLSFDTDPSGALVREVLEVATGKPARQVAFEACRSVDAEMRRVGLGALFDLQLEADEQARALLDAALSDEEPSVRRQAEFIQELWSSQPD